MNISRMPAFCGGSFGYNLGRFDTRGISEKGDYLSLLKQKVSDFLDDHMYTKKLFLVLSEEQPVEQQWYKEWGFQQVPLGVNPNSENECYLYIVDVEDDLGFPSEDYANYDDYDDELDEDWD